MFNQRLQEACFNTWVCFLLLTFLFASVQLCDPKFQNNCLICSHKAFAGFQSFSLLYIPIYRSLHQVQYGRFIINGAIPERSIIFETGVGFRYSIKDSICLFYMDRIIPDRTRVFYNRIIQCQRSSSDSLRFCTPPSLLPYSSQQHFIFAQYSL